MEARPDVWTAFIMGMSLIMNLHIYPTMHIEGDAGTYLSTHLCTYMATKFATKFATKLD